MERIRLESVEELRAELDRWRGLVDHLPALVAFWDAETRNVVANSAYLDWFGLKPSELRGMPIREVLGGEVIGFYVLVTDITEQVETQRELDAAQALAHVGSFTLRLPTQEITWSREMFRIAGKDPDTYVPDVGGWMEMVHPDDVELARSLRGRAMAGVPYEASYRIVRDDGEIRHVHSVTRADVDDSGAAVLLRGTLQDETKAQRTAAELAVANTLLTDLIGMLGHDLRQPVSVVQGYLEALEEHWDTLDDATARAHLRTALRGAARVDGLLQDLLALVNLDTSTLEVRPADLDVAELVEAVLERSPGAVSVAISEAPTVRAGRAPGGRRRCPAPASGSTSCASWRWPTAARSPTARAARTARNSDWPARGVTLGPWTRSGPCSDDTGPPAPRRSPRSAPPSSLWSRS